MSEKSIDSNFLSESSGIDVIPSVLYRGERIYLSNVDKIGQHDLSTVGYERTQNKDGRVYLARDKEYATSYSIGTDGVVWYDRPLSKWEIPIGVIYEIDNHENVIGAVAEGDPLPDLPQLGSLAGQYREFTANYVPATLCKVLEIQIMDDYVKPGGHRRSDMRDILETFYVSDQEQLPKVIKMVKERIDELDKERNI